MRKLPKLVLVGLLGWFTILYGHALLAMADHGAEVEAAKIPLYGNYWSPNPALAKDEGEWDTRSWKWHEFLGCGSEELVKQDAYNYVRWPSDGVVEVGMLTPPQLDWVYVAGISAGNVWNDTIPAYQPEPLRMDDVSELVLETKVTEWRGAPLSPVIFPSWYAVLTDVWFRVSDVTIDEGEKHFDSKILGIDIFYHTMTGGLNVVMGGGSEFSRIEPCNGNFVYSVNLAGQEFYTVKDGLYQVDLLYLLERAQQEAARQGWHFEVENAELVMQENVVESYWSSAYSRINHSGIRFCTQECE